MRTERPCAVDEELYGSFVALVRSIYGDEFVPLHRPVFIGNEKLYLEQCIDSNFVSSAGKLVTRFEEDMARFIGCDHAIATMNGTAALHTAIVLAGVKPGDEVISQALTFIATANAISYAHAKPVFIDVDRDTLGMSPEALRLWLDQNVTTRDGSCVNRRTGARIGAVVPMHTFGLPCRISEIATICESYGIPLLEDAAESLGSYVGGIHTGRFGKIATLSFNGNKVITTGGGGMLVTDDPELARRAKHLTTTAKVPHDWEFVHDEVGYNYRLPSLNAALGIAQLEKLPAMLKIKAQVAETYAEFCQQEDLQFVRPIHGTKSNYWLNAIVLKDHNKREAFLEYTNSHGIMTRPIWRLISSLTMYQKCESDGLENSRWLEERIVNVPSSVPDWDFGELMR